MNTLFVSRLHAWNLLFSFILGCAWASSALSQSYIGFDNIYVDAPIYDVDGKTLLAGPAFAAQLYVALPGKSLEPLGSPSSFSTERPGFFGAQTFLVPGMGAGDYILAQVAAWRVSDGSTFEAANRPGGHVGASSVFSVGPLTGGLQPPTVLEGLQSFSLQVVVPEPSVFALGLLGGLALVLGRRRGRFR